MSIGGTSELARAISRYRAAFWTVVALSAVLNVLLLAGSIYMMLIYDSVLPSASLPSLFGLLAMLLVAYVFQAVFDMARGRILAGVGAALERALGGRVQRSISDLGLYGGRVDGDGLTAMRDLDNIRGFLATGGPAALIDLPWIVFFMAVLFLLHVWLGVAGVIGAAILIALTVFNDRATRNGTRDLGGLAANRSGMAESNLRHVELFASMGMRERLRLRWEGLNRQYLEAQDQLGQTVSRTGSISRILRLLLQSVMLTVGAVLVIDGEASGGVIFASSILFGRALAPVDTAIANWRSFAAAREGWARLNRLFEAIPEGDDAQVLLPLPKRDLAVEHLHLSPPGTQRVTLTNADFRLSGGDCLAVIGPSGAGKTSLARALIGVWRPLRGQVRFDGAAIDQYDPERFGEAIGYLPQTVELIDGTVAENISRFAPEADSAAIIAAAQAAGVHELIVRLPEGYDTSVGRDGAALSAGQRQRVGLARALYGEPFLVVLDEPNSNLDQDGELALEQAINGIKGRGGIAVLITHRPSLLARATHVLFVRDGRVERFGPRDEVLDSVLAKPQPIQVQQSARRAGPRPVGG